MNVIGCDECSALGVKRASFSSEQQFLEMFGKQAESIGPGIYRVNRGSGRSMTVGFGESARVNDIERPSAEPGSRSDVF